jgi:hypothetical protein
MIFWRLSKGQAYFGIFERRACRFAADLAKTAYWFQIHFGNPG